LLLPSAKEQRSAVPTDTEEVPQTGADTRIAIGFHTTRMNDPSEKHLKWSDRLAVRMGLFYEDEQNIHLDALCGENELVRTGAANGRCREVSVVVFLSKISA
jgi:hypothetical protein